MDPNQQSQNPEDQQGPEQQAPGQTVEPSIGNQDFYQQSQPIQQQPQQPMQPQQPTRSPVLQQPEQPQEPEQPPAPPQTPQEQIQVAGQQQNQWQYTSGQLTADNQPTKPELDHQDEDGDGILAEWSASEFVEHSKGTKWFFYLAVGTTIVSVILYLITRELMSVVVTVLLAVVLAIYAKAKPKTINYAITSHGIALDDKHYEFNEFKSFSIINDSAIPYIQLMPQKRLAIPITIYVDPAHTDDVTDIIGQYLPYDQQKRDVVDKLSSKFKF